ncbi:hypothetical protein AOA12_18545 [Microbacterium sp. No. 7]|nr:hypothetical protein AOA12_18545 [Microbacterium sp. No. 7]
MADHDGVTTDIARDHTALAAIADALRAAEIARTPIAPPSQTWPGLTVEDAYAVQRIGVRRRVEAGERIVGRKIGLTSLPMQQQLGVDQPDFGAVTDRMVLANGGALDVSALIAPRVEAEFAFRIGRDLPVSPSPTALEDAIDGVALALEIIDSRVADWRITLVDTVADNASSARIVHGDVVPATSRLRRELPGTVITLVRDGEEACSGPGSAVLGDPLHALHWLAKAIGAYGDRFLAGDVVLAGAVAASVPLVPGARWTAHADGLPPVSLTSTSQGSEASR